MPTTMQFEIVDEMYRDEGSVTFRTRPPKGVVLFEGRAVEESIDFTFDRTQLRFDGLEICDLAIYDCKGEPDKDRLAAYVHVCVGDADTLNLLKLYKPRETLQLEVETPTHGKWKGTWHLDKPGACVVSMRAEKGTPIFCIERRYKTPEEVFGGLTEVEAA